MNQKKVFTFSENDEAEEEKQTEIIQESPNRERTQISSSHPDITFKDEKGLSSNQFEIITEQRHLLDDGKTPDASEKTQESSQMIEIITNISYPAPPPLLSRKKPINLFLPVKLIELAEKETAFPTDGNSQKKKSNVFSFYDNFHEYTVFCDVAMKKCSRNYQEDRFSAINPLDQKNDNDAFFAVFDGHGTSVIADILKEHLHTYICQNEHYQSDIHRAIKESFQKIDDEILKKQKDNLMVSGGSTALCCLIKEDKLYVINCGDSSSVLVSNEYNVEVLNNLHKPCQKEEAAWLQQKNTLFTQQRVFGTLAITRAFGDYKLKEYIISEPEIKVYQIDSNSKYCLLGTDGFWDIIDYKKDLPDLLKTFNQQFEGQERTSLKDLSTFLVDIASKKTTQSKKDNMTLLAIDLNWFYRKHTEIKEDEGEERQISSNGSSIIVCSQTQSQAENGISSFLFQAKSPLSVSKKSSLASSLNNSKNNELPHHHEGPKTCGKQKNPQKAFFSSDHSDDERPPQISQATSIFFAQITNSTIQIEENKQNDEIKQTQETNSSNNDMFIFSNDAEKLMSISQPFINHNIKTSTFHPQQGFFTQINQINEDDQGNEQDQVITQNNDEHNEKQQFFQFRFSDKQN